MLLGEEALLRLREAVVVVAGLGGVGAYAAEMVARAGVGRMVLIDSDRVGESNKNRQLLALDSTLGRLKTEVMAERLLDINPELGSDGGKAAGHQSGTAYRESSGISDGGQYPRGV